MFACYTEQITAQNQIIKISTLRRREAVEWRQRRGAHYNYNAEMISDIPHSIPSPPLPSSGCSQHSLKPPLQTQDWIKTAQGACRLTYKLGLSQQRR